MVVTDKFVFIHLPKTGGTFVTDTLIKLHGGRWDFLKMCQTFFMKEKLVNPRNHAFGPVYLVGLKHGVYRRIPDKHQHLPVLSVVRHPLDYYVSEFEFGWWKRRKWMKYYRQVPGFKELFPNFPNLDFIDFLQLLTMTYNPVGHRRLKDPDQMGHATQKFIRFFCPDPDQVFDTANKGQLDVQALRTFLPEIHFLHTEELNAGLYQFLLEKGYPASQLRHILNKPKVLPGGKGRSSKQKWEGYYTEQLQFLFRQKDQLLFDLFPRYK